ncbi:hypothetical protein AGMMS49593_10580 [Endomicrobiia bacterium]|nr:hypothetical protein AGMMS49593_10580 [Endomicrobiia bacterium]
MNDWITDGIDVLPADISRGPICIYVNNHTDAIYSPSLKVSLRRKTALDFDEFNFLAFASDITAQATFVRSEINPDEWVPDKAGFHK